MKFQRSSRRWLMVDLQNEKPCVHFQRQNLHANDNKQPTKKVSQSVLSHTTRKPLIKIEVSITTKKLFRAMNDQPATLLSHEEVRPQSFRGRGKSTRLQKYRRKMRKRRNRRMGIILLLTMATVASVIAYKMYHPEFTTQQFVPQETLNLHDFDRVLENAANKMEASIQQAQEAAEQGIAKLKSIINSNDSMSAKDVIKDRKVGRPPPVVEEPVKVEKVVPVEEPPEPKPVPTIPVESAIVVRREANTMDNVEERPALCNLPLSYIVHRRCWRLASKNPVFNLNGLVQDMMQ